MPSDRHLLVVHESPSGLGGSQSSMLAGVRALRDRGWRISLLHGESGPLGPKGADHFDATFSVPHAFTRHPTPAAARGAVRLDRLLARIDPELVHHHLWPNPFVLRATRRQRPTVVTCHLPVCPNGARYHYAKERVCEAPVGRACAVGFRRHGCGTTADGTSFGPVSFAVTYAYARLSLAEIARCDAVIAPSRWQERSLVRDGVPPERVSVLPPLLARPLAGDEHRTAHPSVVLAAARLVVLKGLHHLLRASAAMQAPHEVHIAGAGPSEHELRTLARDLRIEGSVRFLGALDPGHLDAAYRAAAVVCVPSLWPETFGMTGPEALAQGTRVVAYDSGGIADWARTASGATMVPAGDVAALTSALDDAVTRAAAPTVPDPSLEPLWDSERHAARLTDVYAGALARRSAG